MSFTPIFIPTNFHHEPSRCPKCDHIEDTKTECRYCGYEYADDDDPSPWLIIPCVLGGLAVLAFVMTTVMDWVFDQAPHYQAGNHTLLWHFGDNLSTIWSLLKNIW